MQLWSLCRICFTSLSAQSKWPDRQNVSRPGIVIWLQWTRSNRMTSSVAVQISPPVALSLCVRFVCRDHLQCYTPVEVVFLPLLKLRRRNATYILQIIVISIKNRHVTCFYFFQSVTSITVSFHSHLCVTLSGLSSVSWAKLGACGFFHCGLQPENTVKTTWLQPPSVNQWYCEIFKANG